MSVEQITIIIFITIVMVLAVWNLVLSLQNKKIKELKADYGNKAQVERDLLQIIIDKAIEYIETHIIEDNEYENYMQCEREEKEELLNILIGSDNNV